MKKIYKYEIKPKGETRMPKGANILSVAAQGESIQMWAEVDPNNDLESRMFEVFPTGAELIEDMGIERKFLATVFMHWMVFHIYERIN